jgi:hypothetical protein
MCLTGSVGCRYRDRGRERGKSVLRQHLKSSANTSALSPFPHVGLSSGGPASCGTTPHANQRQPFFLMTGMDDVRKAEFIEAIMGLDGKVCPSRSYMALLHILVRQVFSCYLEESARDSYSIVLLISAFTV